MKIIFLDIDGVLNFWGSEARATSGALGIVNSKVKLLKHIVDETGARIVLTSSWRHHWLTDDGGIAATGDGIYMVGKFDRYGLHILDKIKDKYESMRREEGINEWLKDKQYIENYLILDDEVDFYTDLTHCVFTHGDTGLTEYEADIAIKILNGEEI